MRKLLVLMGIWGIGAGVLGGGQVAGAAESQAEKPPSFRPNILFIFADDHAWQAISCYGEKRRLI